MVDSIVDTAPAESKVSGPLVVTLILLLGIGGYFAYDKLDSIMYESKVVQNIHPYGTKEGESNTPNVSSETTPKKKTSAD